MPLINYIRFFVNILFIAPVLSLQLHLRLGRVKRGYVWILGNGPSLKKFSTESVMRSDTVIVCNHFYANAFSDTLQIDYYCCSDPRLFEDRAWLENVMKLNVSKIIVPFRQVYKIPLKYQSKVIYYNYVPYFKLWETKLKFLKNTNILFPLKTGDTVVFDVMLSLAARVAASRIKVVGVDLAHGGGVLHSYDESLVTGPRRSNDYLNSVWEENTSLSFDIIRQTPLFKEKVDWTFVE